MKDGEKNIVKVMEERPSAQVYTRDFCVFLSFFCRSKVSSEKRFIIVGRNLLVSLFTFEIIFDCSTRWTRFD